MSKLDSLRTLMREHKLDAYIITGADPHMSGYVAPHFRTREWISGFSGSAGTVAVLPDMAGLWTDGRYFIQAEAQLEGSGIDLYKSGEPDVPTVTDFLKGKLQPQARVGVYGQTISAAELERMRKALKEVAADFVTDACLIGLLWDDRPVMTFSEIYEHDMAFVDRSSCRKLALVREEMQKAKIDAYLVASLDDIAWLLNIRAADLPTTPVAYAYMFITDAAAHVFADTSAIAPMKHKLEAQGYVLHDYADIMPFLQQMGSTEPKQRLCTNKNKTAASLAGVAAQAFEIIKGDDIISHKKAIKTPHEIICAKKEYVFEGAVLTQIMHKVKTTNFAREAVTETEIADELVRLRRGNPNYVSDSFSAIVAYGANAAQSHYNTSDVRIGADGFLLIDTGGQYLGATTDTTRTLALGAPTPQMKRDYTLVLKGHIALSRAVFLKGTTGAALDVLARCALWRNGQNYRHGTGHGIGYFLNVHEGPQSVSQHTNPTALAPGMMLSNEPAVYRPHEYGIRTENILLVCDALQTPDGTFYKFDTLTCCPYDIDAIDAALLDTAEREWINSYHAWVRDTLEPLLPQALWQWLGAVTAAI